jgi:hypothetical protein
MRNGPIALLEQKYPQSMFVITPHFGFWDRNDELDSPTVSEAPKAHILADLTIKEARVSMSQIYQKNRLEIRSISIIVPH